MKIKIPSLKVSLTLIFATCVIVFLLHYLVVGQATYGDGRAYYSYLLSIFYDSDLRMENQTIHHWEPGNNNSLNPIKESTLFFIPENAVGSSLFWLPPLFASIRLSKLFNTIFSFNLPLHGYSHIPQITVGIFTIMLFVLGMYFSYRNLRIFFDHNRSSLAVFFVWLSTNLFYYSSIDVLNSHAISFFLCAYTLYQILKKPVSTAGSSFVRYGFLFGLIFIVREQDLFTILPIFLYRSFHDKNSLSSILMKIPHMVLGFFLPYAIQLIYNFQNFNAPFHPHFNIQQWKMPNLIDFLVSPRRGSILLYSPSILLGIYGLIRSKIPERKVFLSVLVLQMILSSAWNEGSSYGPRTIIATYPIIAFGLAEVLKDRSVKPILLILSLFNFVMIFAFLLLSTGTNSSGIDPTTFNRIIRIKDNLQNIW